MAPIALITIFRENRRIVTSTHMEITNAQLVNVDMLQTTLVSVSQTMRELRIVVNTVGLMLRL